MALSFIARGSSEEIWVARASAEAMLRYSPRAIGQPQTKFMAIMCIILENTKKNRIGEKSGKKRFCIFHFFFFFACFWSTRSASTPKTKLHHFISLELKGSYCSNKIIKKNKSASEHRLSKFELSVFFFMSIPIAFWSRNYWS